MLIKFKKFEKGFSIMEVLLAVFVLLVGLLGLLLLITNSMSNSIDSRDQIVASALAQEGVELARNLHDTDVVRGNSLFSGAALLPQAPSANHDCVLDNTISIACSQNISQETLHYSSSTGFYSTSAGSATKFKRKIDLTYASSYTANGATHYTLTVVSAVIWGNKDFAQATPCTAQNKCVSTQDVLTD